MRTKTIAAGFVLFALSSRASAIEPGKLGEEEVRIDVTNASSLIYNFDNRDDKQHDVASRANDDWGMWYNRLNLQAAWGKWTAGVRVDNAWFYRSPYPETIAIELEADRPKGPTALPGPVYFRQKLQAAGEELSTRYINWVYPAKYYLGYTTRDVELTAGDFYAQLGRGLVLSVRKLDELASDTTVRGGRVTGRVRTGDLRLRLTALGGSMNPLRIDEASGRYLGVDDTVTPDFLAVTEAGMPRSIETDFLRRAPTYAPDRLVGGQVEIATDDFKLGTQATLLDRQPALSASAIRSADMLTGSQSIEIPDFDGHGAGYLEVALQKLSSAEPCDRDEGGCNPVYEQPGYAVYASVSLLEQPVSLLVEGRHYRRFFPLSANIDTHRAAEFSIVQYSAPPTTEAFWIDTEFEAFNTCVSGGRARADVHVGKDESLFAWVARYYTWAESVSNESCEISDQNLNRVWDVASGLEITAQRRKSRYNSTLGGRIDETDREITHLQGGGTHVFYQEIYARYDLVRWLGGPFSVQLQGWHRRRFQTLGGPGRPWSEGHHLTGVEWGRGVSTAFGVEYDTNPATPDLYFNGQAVYRVTGDTSVSLFVGQRRGSLRCVGGVCRVFPPFEGTRLDATLRF
jgi:hypothetical protein